MPLYTPVSFAEKDRARIDGVIAANSFATVISVVDGEPQVTHAPLEWHPDRQVLRGHIARANPHASMLTDGARVLAIFHGAHGYISPTWYVDENPKAPNVPTWNYAVVHLRGVVTRIDDDHTKWEIVRKLSAHYEGDGPQAWQNGPTGHIDAHRAKLGAVVGFEIAVDRIDAKFKLSQNRSVADQRAEIQQLEARNLDWPGDAAMAKWMRESLESIKSGES